MGLFIVEYMLFMWNYSLLSILSFILQPHVDFGLKLFGADLMSIPGLYRFVQVRRHISFNLPPTPTLPFQLIGKRFVNFYFYFLTTPELHRKVGFRVVDGCLIKFKFSIFIFYFLFL